jgi:SAM-dependent methyltransferase/methyltransferase-like protein
MTSALQASYDELPYESFPFAQTHPDRLATLGWLFGLAPTPIDRCRVLEIGCSSGENLIPVAATLPHSEFVGVDFSTVEIRDGMAEVAAVSLANVRLVAMDIKDFGNEFGTFDYIIAHGVYSWVSNEVQNKLLSICARQLSPSGIAYVSYNTLPGWRMRGVVREAMRYHTRRLSDPQTCVPQARAMLEFLAESLRGETSAYGILLREEAERVRRQADFYIFHEYLEEVNEPLYFHQFIERAAQHRLRYLAEADFKSMLARDLAPQVLQTLSRMAPDLLQREQFMDFLRNQTFRQTLLVPEDAAPIRKLSPERLFRLRISTRARPARETPDERSIQPEEFRAPDGSSVTAPRPLTKAAMMALAQNSPAAIAFDDLCAFANRRLGVRGAVPTAERDALASDMLQCFAAGVVELHTAPSPFVIEAGARPEASALVRLQASRGAQVTNLRHESVNLNDDARRMLAMLDGTRTQAEIAAIFWPGESTEAALVKLRPALSQIARQAFLVR